MNFIEGKTWKLHCRVCKTNTTHSSKDYENFVCKKCENTRPTYLKARTGAGIKMNRNQHETIMDWGSPLFIRDKKSNISTHLPLCPNCKKNRMALNSKQDSCVKCTKKYYQKKTKEVKP